MMNYDTHNHKLKILKHPLKAKLRDGVKEPFTAYTGSYAYQLPLVLNDSLQKMPHQNAVPPHQVCAG